MAVLLGVGASERDVGVLDLDTGVVDFSFYNTKRQRNSNHRGLSLKTDVRWDR